MLARSMGSCPAARFPAGHGVHPPSRSPLRRAKEGRPIPELGDLPSPAEAGFAKAGGPHAQRESARLGRTPSSARALVWLPSGRVQHQNSQFKAIVFYVRASLLRV